MKGSNYGFYFGLLVLAFVFVIVFFVLPVVSGVGFSLLDGLSDIAATGL